MSFSSNWARRCGPFSRSIRYIASAPAPSVSNVFMMRGSALPLLAGFLRLLPQAHLLPVDALDPIGGNVMMLALRLRVVLGELDAIALDLVHGPDRLAVRAHDLHLLANLRSLFHERGSLSVEFVRRRTGFVLQASYQRRIRLRLRRSVTCTAHASFRS